MAQVRRQVDVFRPMYQIIRRINLGGDVRAALEAVTQGVVEAVGFQVAAISWLTSELDFEVVFVAGSDAARGQLLGTRVTIAEMEAELLASDRWGSLLFLPAGRLDGVAAGWVSDADAPTGPDEHDPEHDPEHEAAERWDREDALRCPLRAPDGELLGLLSVDLPLDGHRPGAARRELLEMYGDLAGLALNNASRATALEERVRLASAVQAALVSNAGQLDVAGLAEAAVTPIAQALRASSLWLRILDPRDLTQPGLVARAFGEEGPPVPAAVMVHAAAEARARWQAGEVSMGVIRDDRWLATSSAWLDREEHVAVADGRAGWVRRRSAVFAPVTPEQEEVTSYLRPSGVRYLLMCPVGVGADCLGYFVAGRRSGPDWSSEEIEAVGRIARHLGQAVLTARLLDRERVLVHQLEALDRYKNDLISTVSHELRTPLTSVMGHLELIEDATAGGSPVGGLDVVRRNLDRMLALTDELLLLKRISGSADDDRGVVDLHRVAVEVVGAFRPDADARGVTLSLVPHGGPVLITGHPAELERVVLNLVDNAMKYTPSGGAVEVSTEHSDRFVRLVVRDTGIGISPRDQEELFTEFFRSTNPDALAMPGTGLGLSIVRRIVQRHGGSIRLTSEPGAGSTFTVRLPLSHARPE